MAVLLRFRFFFAFLRGRCGESDDIKVFLAMVAFVKTNK